MEDDFDEKYNKKGKKTLKTDCKKKKTETKIKRKKKTKRGWVLVGFGGKGGWVSSLA